MLPQNVNYALKSDAVSAFLGSVPEVSAKLKKPYTAIDRKLEDVTKEVSDGTALVIVTR
jgi:hypothetical protein